MMMMMIPTPPVDNYDSKFRVIYVDQKL